MSMSSDAHNIALCVDLDGTLLTTDSLWESLVALVLRNPFILFSVLSWMVQGKARLKLEVAARSNRAPSSWPYRQEVLDLIRLEKANGRKVVLATGAPALVAQGIAEHLGLFDVVLHSTQDSNLTATAKKNALVEMFGEQGFDYIGNSRDDICLFEVARQAIIVAPDQAALRWQKAHSAELLVPPPSGFKTVLKTMRIHQWLKNTLLVVPLILHHQMFNVGLINDVVIAFFSFSFAASFVYILNDLSDLKNDRLHKRKKERPLASGRMQIPTGIWLGAALLLVSLSLSLFLPLIYFVVLLVYIAATTAYSFYLKQKLLVDVFTLAGLFTLRIIAGGAAINLDLSFWLLAFSLFFFLSLALVKRYVELQEMTGAAGSTELGRGYFTEDFEMIGQAGISSAFGAALVLALYVNSEEVQEMYQAPLLLWPLCPMILYMLLRIWMLARRGHMDDDPVVFILRDWRSQMIAVVGALLLALGTMITL